MGATDDRDARLFSPDDWVEGKPTGHPSVEDLGLEKETPVTKTTAEPTTLPEKARIFVEQTALLEELRKERQDVDARTNAATKALQEVHTAFTKLATIPGYKKAFSVDDQVVVVSRADASRIVDISIVPLYEKPAKQGA